MTKILQCKCLHEYQNVVYGNGMRVHNMKKNCGWRCTVCLSEKTASADDAAKAK